MGYIPGQAHERWPKQVSDESSMAYFAERRGQWNINSFSMTARAPRAC
jgi:hypothetical protein